MHGTGDLLSQWSQRHAQRIRVVSEDRWILVRDASYKYVEFGLRVRDGHFFSESADDAVIEAAAALGRLLRGESHRHPDIRRLVVCRRPSKRECERGRHDAYHRVGASIELDRFA